jgi:hypothetical protein
VHQERIAGDRIAGYKASVRSLPRGYRAVARRDRELIAATSLPRPASSPTGPEERDDGDIHAACTPSCAAVRVSCRPCTYTGTDDEYMATKTITIDVDAYERLKRVQKPTESFSQTIKRVVREPIGLTAWFAAMDRVAVSRPRRGGLGLATVQGPCAGEADLPRGRR